MATILSPLWRWFITTLDGEILTDLDKLASDRYVIPRLDAPLEFGGTVPSDSPEVNILHTDGFPFLAEGVRQLIGMRRESDTPPYYTTRATGLIMSVNDAAGSDAARTRFVAYDPWQYLYKIPVLKPNSQMIADRGYTFPAGTRGDQIALQVLTSAIVTTPLYYPTATVPAAAEVFFLDVSGPFEATSVFPDRFTVQQGESIGQVWDRLCATGTMDIVLVPIFDPAQPGLLARMEIRQSYGEWNDSAIFAWDRPSRSLVGIDRLQDGADRANYIQFYNGQGGPPVTPALDIPSIETYGPYWAQQFFPGQTKASVVADMGEWQLGFRKDGKTTVTVNPAPERSPEPFVDFYIGDRVPIFAGSNVYLPNQFRQVLNGYQRVYELPIDMDDNGVETIRQLTVGPAGEPPAIAGGLAGNGITGQVAVNAANQARRGLPRGGLL